jgi:cardiolipin synthase A/B
MSLNIFGKAERVSWKLFNVNEDAWYMMLNDCARAEKSIVLEQFIFANDEFGQKLINVCAARAAAGVKVRFLWDAAGSFSFFGTSIAEDLSKKGIELVFWKTLIPSFLRVQNYRFWYLRNHRRTLVIDDKIGYTGSICVRDAIKNWRDTNVRVEGPVVEEMSVAFEQMWARANKHRPLPKKRWWRFHEFRYITNYPAPGRRHINTALAKAIRKAKTSVLITNPYFVPTHRILRAIRHAALRDVAVQIIIPERSDHLAVDLAARFHFSTLLESGVRIFLYSGNMIHSKTVIVDGEWSTVGSLNLDNVSLLYNFEANLVVKNSDFAKELTDHFETDLREAKEVRLDDWRNRSFVDKFIQFCAWLVSEFL